LPTAHAEGIAFTIKRSQKRRASLAILFDVDNTLLDNDRVRTDLERSLTQDVGKRKSKRYWELFEKLRERLGYADYLGALQWYRREYPHELHLLKLARLLLDYPFRNRLFPGAHRAIRHAQTLGHVGLLSDGDVVFQPRKVERSGLLEAVNGHVLIYVHKERELKDVHRRVGAQHYVLVDDKIRILAAVKKVWKSRVTTVFVRQGHYALDKKLVARYPKADVTIERIGDFAKLSRAVLERREP
jgi:FMN phosphatase YigB (HAD superfamily)